MSWKISGRSEVVVLENSEGLPNFRTGKGDAGGTARTHDQGWCSLGNAQQQSVRLLSCSRRCHSQGPGS